MYEIVHSSILSLESQRDEERELKTNSNSRAFVGASYYQLSYENTRG